MLIKTLDIKFGLWDNPHPSGTPKAKILESQMILKSLGARKPKGLNRVDKISYGHLSLRDEYLSFKVFSMAPYAI